MKIRVLGTGSGLPVLGKHLSCIWVENRGKQFIFDCGDGSIYQMLKAGIAPEDIDAVVITHFHPDHVAGIFMLVQMFYLQGRTKDLPLFIPEREAEFEKIFSMFYTFAERLCYRLKVLPITKLCQHYPELRAIENDHLGGYRQVIMQNGFSNTMRAYSLKVEGERGSFVYSGDLETTDSICNFVKGIDTFLVDAGHPAFEQIQKLKNYGIKRILLTHGVPQETLDKLCNKEGSPFEEAREDIVYEI